MEKKLDDVLKYIDDQKTQHLEELKQFLRIPSVSTRTEHKEDVRKAGQWVVEQLRSAGFDQVTLHETPGHPIVTASSTPYKDRPTVLIYGHYDVQPPEPLELWKTPPFSPDIRDGKLYARGSADDKGQVFLYFKVLQAYKQVTGAFPLNVKVLVEGEEEIGSPNLVPFLEKHAADLACDVIMVSDTHMMSAEQPSITTALRGICALEIKVQGAGRDLHSGTFGGTVANPIQVLSEMLVACKDPKTSRVLIPGFYDDVQALSAADRERLAKMPHDDRKYAEGLGAAGVHGEADFTTIERWGARPTFEVNGMWGGYIGEGVKTVLPSVAHAKVTMRLVANQDPHKVLTLAEQHIRSVAPSYVSVEIKREENNGWPVRVDADTPAMQAAAQAVEKVFGKTPLFTMEGGSIPIISDFKRILKRNTILLGFGLPDDDLHAPNEKFNLEMIEKGKKTLVYALDGIAKAKVN